MVLGLARLITVARLTEAAAGHYQPVQYRREEILGQFDPIWGKRLARLDRFGPRSLDPSDWLSNNFPCYRARSHGRRY